MPPIVKPRFASAITSCRSPPEGSPASSTGREPAPTATLARRTTPLGSSASTTLPCPGIAWPGPATAAPQSSPPRRASGRSPRRAMSRPRRPRATPPPPRPPPRRSSRMRMLAPTPTPTPTPPRRTRTPNPTPLPRPVRWPPTRAAPLSPGGSPPESSRSARRASRNRRPATSGQARSSTACGSTRNLRTASGPARPRARNENAPAPPPRAETGARLAQLLRLRGAATRSSRRAVRGRRRRSPPAGCWTAAPHRPAASPAPRRSS